MFMETAESLQLIGSGKCQESNALKSTFFAKRAYQPFTSSCSFNKKTKGANASAFTNTGTAGAVSKNSSIPLFKSHSSSRATRIKFQQLSPGTAFATEDESKRLKLMDTTAQPQYLTGSSPKKYQTEVDDCNLNNSFNFNSDKKKALSKSTTYFTLYDHLKQVSRARMLQTLQSGSKNKSLTDKKQDDQGTPKGKVNSTLDEMCQKSNNRKARNSSPAYSNNRRVSIPISLPTAAINPNMKRPLNQFLTSIKEIEADNKSYPTSKTNLRKQKRGAYTDKFSKNNLKRVATNKILPREHEFIKSQHIAEMIDMIKGLYEMLLYLGYSKKNIDSLVLACCRKNKDIQGIFMNEHVHNQVTNEVLLTHITNKSELEARIKKLFIFKNEKDSISMALELGEFKSRLEKAVMEKGQNKFVEIKASIVDKSDTLKSKTQVLNFTKQKAYIDTLKAKPYNHFAATGVLSDLNRLQERYGNCQNISMLNRWLCETMNSTQADLSHKTRSFLDHFNYIT